MLKFPSLSLSVRGWWWQALDEMLCSKLAAEFADKYAIDVLSQPRAALRLRVAIPVALIGLVYAVWTLWGAGIGVSAMSLILMAAGLPLYAWTMLSAPAGREEPPVA